MSSPQIEVSKAADGQYLQLVTAGRHVFKTDVPVDAGGEDGGPDPHDLLNAALGACTALTVTMVAQRRKIPLDDLKVTISFSEAGGVYSITRSLQFIGALSEEQKTYLTGIANKCPIHKALTGRFEISTVVAAA